MPATATVVKARKLHQHDLAFAVPSDWNEKSKQSGTMHKSAGKKVNVYKHEYPCTDAVKNILSR